MNLFKKQPPKRKSIKVKILNKTNDSTLLKPFNPDLTSFWINNNKNGHNLMVLQNGIYHYTFETYSHLYGKKVQMNDRFESNHIWSKELAMKNMGRWEPKLTNNELDYEFFDKPFLFGKSKRVVALILIISILIISILLIIKNLIYFYYGL